ncbi:MAG TPA: ABC transporter ATP-binding protein [Lachnospiraceae bacterium]|nr:ABC transporter ATP-binding protein [Lachnospiraceae bacterium]
MSYLFPFIKRYKIKYVLALIIIMITCTISIMSPFISGTIIDKVIIGGSKNLLPIMIAIYLGCSIIRSALKYILTMIFEKTSQDIVLGFRNNMFAQLVNQNFRFFDNHKTGELLSRLTGDIENIRKFMSTSMCAAIEDTFLLFSSLFMICFVDYHFTICIAIIMVSSAIITVKQLDALREPFMSLNEKYTALSSFVQENIDGNRVVKACNQENYEIEKMEMLNQQYRDSELNIQNITKKYAPMFEFISNSTIVLMYLIGGILVILDQITIGKIVTACGYVWMTNMLLKDISWILNDYRRFKVSVDKINHLMSETYLHQESDKSSEAKPNKVYGDIEFEKVSFKYNDRYVLQDINFKIKRGMKVGIIGKTGSGKSTLMHLLCKFYKPIEGKIKINNQDINEIDTNVLRNSISICMQNNYLFSKTIYDNISFGTDTCTSEDIFKYAHISDADSFIDKMPEGYQTIIGEEGVGLSGGQRQRVSLARALIADREILILDDTTSAVDMHTEVKIIKRIRDIAKKFTFFIISQRIFAVKDADIILVMDGGRIIESGTHEELIESKNYYYSLYRQQKGFIKGE